MVLIDLIISVNIDVLKERHRQNVLWGLQRHDLGKWLSLLIEEVGEVAQAMQPVIGLSTSKSTDANDLYTELIHVSAVASAIAEQIKEGDYNGKSWGNDC